MPAPTSYTEAELADFMLATLSDVASVLGWTAQADIQEAINEALIVYGVEDIADVSGMADIAKLRRIATVTVWRAAVNAFTAQTDFSTSGQSFKASGYHAQALKNLDRAQWDALSDLGSYRATITTVQHKHDPYAYLTDAERTL